jgi:putative flavoprotein involved in K+ transport
VWPESQSLDQAWHTVVTGGKSLSDPDEVLVVGAGPAGLATAAMVQRRGVPALVLERSDRVASSWRSRYDSLILNTPRFTSTLAGYRMPRRYGRWPTRDQVVEYLEDYARRMKLRIRFGVEARRLQRRDGGWSLETSESDLEADNVVIATGHDVEPVIPAWPGKEEFPGELVHSAEYRNPDPYRGQDVLVVSASNSGSEIAYELASNGAARVWTSMRTPPPVVPREWLGMPLNYSACLLDLLPDRLVDQMTKNTQWMIYRDLSRYGLPAPPYGIQTRAKKLHQGVLIDAGFVDALKRGQVEIVAAVREFDGPEAVLVDETRLRPDAVIAATGFESGLVPLVGHLGVLEASGYPAVVGRRTHPRAPGLYFTGYLGTVSGQLRHMRRHARAIARAIARGRKR